jgi:hypothetical protein
MYSEMSGSDVMALNAAVLLMEIMDRIKQTKMTRKSARSGWLKRRDTFHLIVCDCDEVCSTPLANKQRVRTT